MGGCVRAVISSVSILRDIRGCTNGVRGPSWAFDDAEDDSVDEEGLQAMPQMFSDGGCEVQIQEEKG